MYRKMKERVNERDTSGIYNIGITVVECVLVHDFYLFSPSVEYFQLIFLSIQIFLTLFMDFVEVICFINL